MDTDIRNLINQKLGGSNAIWFKIGAAVIPVIISGTVAWTTLGNTVDTLKTQVSTIEEKGSRGAIDRDVKMQEEISTVKSDQAVTKEKLDLILKTLDKIDRKLDRKKDK